MYRRLGGRILGVVLGAIIMIFAPTATDHDIKTTPEVPTAASKETLQTLESVGEDVQVVAERPTEQEESEEVSEETSTELEVSEEVSEEAPTEPEMSEEVSEETSPEESVSEWQGTVLNAYLGVVQGPSGKETYYNLPMERVISNMKELGYDYEYWVREDGVKMYGSYIMCAADWGIRPRGTILETSLGTAMVCDTGDFATGAFTTTQVDIAVDW